MRFEENGWEISANTWKHLEKSGKSTTCTNSHGLGAHFWRPVITWTGDLPGGRSAATPKSFASPGTWTGELPPLDVNKSGKSTRMTRLSILASFFSSRFGAGKSFICLIAEPFCHRSEKPKNLPECFSPTLATGGRF